MGAAGAARRGARLYFAYRHQRAAGGHEKGISAGEQVLPLFAQQLNVFRDKAYTHKAAHLGYGLAAGQQVFDGEQSPLKV